MLLLYSLLLTHGVEAIAAEWDDASCALLGSHSYCSQELVNLLLLGAASSNVFDGRQALGDTLLRGIQQRSSIGFLSLHEHYENIEVGSFLKTPLYPLWIVCSESHYSVLFALDKSDDTMHADTRSTSAVQCTGVLNRYRLDRLLCSILLH